MLDNDRITVAATKPLRLKKWHWTLIVMVVMCISYYLYATRGRDVDYSNTQWITVEGKKYSTFRPEIQMKYFTNTDIPGCGNRKSWKNLGHAFPGEYRQTYFPTESDGGKYYSIKFPKDFSVGHCRYNTGGAKLYMEEKSDDPRLVNDPEYERGRTKRSTIIAANNITTLLFRSKNHVNTQLNKVDTFIDATKIDMFCYREKHIAGASYIGIINSLYCGTASEKYKQTVFIYYSKEFLANNPIRINLKVSNKTYCKKAGKNYCIEKHEKDLPQIPRNFRSTIKPDWFIPFNEEDNPDAR